MCEIRGHNKEPQNMNASMQQKKWKNKGEEPEKINTSFTNQKTEEEELEAE